MRLAYGRISSEAALSVARSKELSGGRQKDGCRWTGTGRIALVVHAGAPLRTNLGTHAGHDARRPLWQPGEEG